MLIVPQVADKAESSRAGWYSLLLIVPLSYAISGYLLKKTAHMGISYLQLLLVTNALSGVFFLIFNDGFYISPDIESLHILYFFLGIVFNIAAVSLMLYLAKSTTPLVVSFSNYATILFSFVLTAFYFGGHQMGVDTAVAVFLIIGSSLITGSKKTN